MTQWGKIISEVQRHQRVLAEAGCDTPFYRGHQDASWKLQCSLGRGSRVRSRDTIESVLYYDFMSLGGPLFPQNVSPWDVAFAMQHHGLPTRLLDWTATFSVALYFAIAPHTKNPKRSTAKAACVWMLDPFELNQHAGGESAIFNPRVDLKGDYYENFIIGSKSLDTPVMAVNPTRISPRQAAQKSVFTLHNDIWTPLEDFAPDQLKKIEIPKECFPDAIAFLNLSGINEYSLFPDFDGLARQLRHEHSKDL